MTTPKKLQALDGNSQRLDGGAMFGNAPKALWSRWIEPDELNRIPLACRALLVREPDRNILFETGIGAFFPPDLRERFGVVESENLLLRSLESAGLTSADIDVIVLSHLHFDHAGGLLKDWQEDAPLALDFPNAQFVAGEAAWDRAQNPTLRDRASFIPELPDLLNDSGRLQIFSGDTSDLLGSDYRFHRSDGHTLGMMLAEIETETTNVVIAADLVPATPWAHLPITMGYDRFPEKMVEEKTRYFADWIERDITLFFTHDAATPFARLTQNEKGRYAAEPVDSVD